MAQSLTDLGNHPDARSGKLAASVPPKPASGAAVGTVYASAAPDGYIGWHPGADVSIPKNAAITQPVNVATL